MLVWRHVEQRPHIVAVVVRVPESFLNSRYVGVHFALPLVELLRSFPYFALHASKSWSAMLNQRMKTQHDRTGLLASTSWLAIAFAGDGGMANRPQPPSYPYARASSPRSCVLTSRRQCRY
jgi:hypothetical protein